MTPDRGMLSRAVGSFLGRRPETTHPVRVLTASGRRIDLTAKSAARARQRAAWQKDAWQYRNTIPEVWYAMAFLRHASSRVRLVPALAQPDGDEPTRLFDSKGRPTTTDIPVEVVNAARDALLRLTCGTYQWSALLEPYAENLEVVGECYLVGYHDTDPDGVDAEIWEIRSIDELTQTDKGWQLVEKEGDREGRILDPETAFVCRLWKPHPQWKQQADSPMRALLDPCEELALVSAAVRNSGRSRLAGNGVVLMDDRIMPGPGVPDVEDSDADPFFSEFTRVVQAAVSDETAPESLLPIFLTMSTPDGMKLPDLMHHLTFDRPMDDKLLERGEKALSRIGTGLDVPPEIITGVADANHWSAWAIDDSTFRHHLEPLIVRMCDGLTAGYLRAVLPLYGVDPVWAARVVVWYDASALTKRPNRVDDAKAGHSANVLSNKVLVEALGFDPDTDMPTEEELAQRLALQKGTVDPALLELLLRLLVLPQLPEVERTPAALPAGPGDDAQPADEDDGDDDGETPGPSTGIRASATLVAAGGPTLTAHERTSRRLARIDSTLRENLTRTADAALVRAVERASNRVRAQANKDAEARAIVASVRGSQAAAALGQTVVAALGLDTDTLLAGAWDELQATWEQDTAAAAQDAVDLAVQMTGLDPAVPQTQTVVDQLLAALTGAAATGLTFLLAQLSAEATRLLYDPAADEPVPDDAVDVGEDPSRRGAVASLVRGALAHAGGVPASAGGITSQGLAAQAGARVGGIAGGDTIDTFLRDQGVQILAYEWVYGISQRHFRPHQDLDGVWFSDFDSPALDNPQSWPHPTLAPGDHKGCHCDAMPIYADGLASVAVDQAADATYDDSYLQVLRRVAADDLAAGRTDTDAVRTVAEADRIANARPSKRS